ncbi:MAG: hypothetical protein FJ395_06075 [Verrucomicrobia bacterium]|nr:hypothetical protein [Verrucomicrobiota bacterium]
MTVKQMIERFEREHKEIQNRLSGFDLEVRRAKENHANLAQAIAILVTKCSQETGDSQLCADTYKEIMEWLNKLHSF